MGIEQDGVATPGSPSAGSTPAPAFLLREYQIDGIDFLDTKGFGYLADEPGLGKSAQLAMAAHGRTLIVAPAYVLEAGVWDDELARWAPQLSATQTSYTSLCERERTAKGGSRPVPRLRPDLLQEHWDTVILDEAHHTKGRDTTHTKAAMTLARRTERLFLASGTPIPNWPYELWTALVMLHEPGDRRFSSFWRWAREWFKVSKHRRGNYEIGHLHGCSMRCPVPCEHWTAFQEANFEGRMLMRYRDDVLTDLPPLTEQTIRVKMTPAQERVYKALRRDFIAWVEETGREVVAWNAGAQATKLAQVATGVEVVDPGARASGKLDALRGLLADGHVPALVVAHFRASVRAAADVVRALGLEPVVVSGDVPPAARGRLVRAFQQGTGDVLVATIDSIAEGVTLTRAGTVIFLEHSWRPSRNQQTLRRIHRMGQDRPVTVVHLVTRASVDGRMQRVLATKTDRQVRALTLGELADLA